MSVVQYERVGNVAVVTLNRPEARNALSPEVLVRLDDAWREVAADDGVRVAVLTGAGDKAFCAGADLARLVPLMSGARSAEDEYDERLLADGALANRATLRVTDLDKPVIAAINGSAIAGGMEIVQGTDLRIAAEGAKFGVQEVKWALFPMGGSTVRLPAQLPHAIAMELLLTGDLIDAQQALAYGFVNRVVPAAEVLRCSIDLAERIAANGPLAVRAVKRSVRDCLGHPEVEAMAREITHGGPVFATEDAREGPRAFLEKRPPVFRSR